VSQPDLPDLFAVLEATWPPAARHRAGPWLLRDGAGGGKRVSAATAQGPVTAANLAAAGDLVMVRAGEAALDAMLAEAGYRMVDPTLLYLAPIDSLATPPPRLTAIPIWPPLAIQRRLWAEAGIGPARVAVMERAAGPKTALLGRVRDRAAGTAFVALHDDVAMVHALEVVPGFRRAGVARNLMQGAACWARAQGARWMALAVTEANAGARALYAALGMREAGRYHYRAKGADA
jgi:N-acetylglutamate synthase